MLHRLGVLMKLHAHGIDLTLPDGWEGGIRSETPAGLAAAGMDQAARGFANVHVATVPLPPQRGDFGGDVVPLLGEDDIFVALLEYGPDEVGSPLFADRGLPRRLDPRRFDPNSLHRTLAGHVGQQRFFTAAGRAFCLYVVLGSAADVHRQTRRVEQVLAGIVIDPTSAAASGPAR